MATRELSEADLGHTLTLASGDELVLDLADRPSTGYRWTVERIDPAVLAAREGTYQPESNKLGAPGIRRLVFVALAAGTTELGLKRARGDAVERRLAVKIVVS